MQYVGSWDHISLHLTLTGFAFGSRFFDRKIFYDQYFIRTIPHISPNIFLSESSIPSFPVRCPSETSAMPSDAPRPCYTINLLECEISNFVSVFMRETLAKLECLYYTRIVLFYLFQRFWWFYTKRKYSINKQASPRPCFVTLDFRQNRSRLVRK